MSYSSGISGGSNLYDMFRYRQALADKQTSAASAQSVWPDFSQGTATASSPASASPTSAASKSTSPASGTQSGAATAGSTSSLSSELANLLMEFQQVLGQMEQTANAGTSGGPGSPPPPPGSPAADGTSAATASASATGASASASATDPSQQAAATQPHHHHHHRPPQSASSSTTDANGSGTPSSDDPLAQLLGTAAGTSGGTVTKSTFEQTFANGENTAKADKIFSALDQNSDGTIDQSEAQNALKHLQQPWNAAGMQSPFGTTQTGGQGNSSQGSWLSGSNLLLAAQQMGQAA